MDYMPAFIQATYNGEDKSDYALKAKIAMDGLAEHPQDAEFIYSYACSFLHIAKLHEECIVHCNKYLPLVKTWQCRNNMLSSVAASLEELEKFDEAMAIKKQMLEETKINKPGYASFEIIDIAESYEKKEDYANAVAYYEMLEEDNRDDNDYEKLATYYEKLKDWDNAAKYNFKTAQHRCRESAWFWSNTGRMLAMAGKEADAKFYFEVALKIDPEDAYTHYYLGLVYQKKDDMYRALHHYTEALKIQPEFPEVYTNLAALSFNEEGNIQEAITNIKTALQQNPDNNLRITSYLNLARLYNKISDYDNHEYYKAKMMEAMGFPTEFEEGDEDEEEIEDI